MGYRITAGAGLGYVAYETPTGRLAVDARVTGVFEELDGREQQNPAFRWGPNLNQYIVPDVLEAFHNHSILAVADSDRGQIFDSSTGPRMHVSEHLDATATVDVRYETEPAPGCDVPAHGLPPPEARLGCPPSSRDRSSVGRAADF